MENQKACIVKSGFWYSADKNPFWLNVVGEKVFWLGMNNKTATSQLATQWCHVGHGELNGNHIFLEWSDIPVGKDQLYGSITIEIIDDTHLKVIEDSGNFGKSEWEWVAENKSFSEL
ncbi:hypothetical protein V6R21_08885 [Limibacter armeniacum]|uniref:hypothetical protein n=1 Tax=Limibacter armeniacum TaxID=466084 RepID=UPI002FE5C568